jgi:hypothetical protein
MNHVQKLPFVAAALSAAFLCRPAAAQTKMTDDQKIQWYCAQHADEGDNCAAHARQLLPYLSDYANSPDTDTRGQAIQPDANGCDFSPLPAGCPGASAPDEGSASGAGSGGGGQSLGGQGVSTGGPAAPRGGTADGGAPRGGGGGLTSGPCNSNYIKSKDTIPLIPADYCADQEGVNFSVMEITPGKPMNNGVHFHFSSSSALSVGSIVGKAGTRSICAETDSPGAGRVNDHCSMEIWVSLKPGGPALGKCGNIGPISEGDTLELSAGATAADSCTFAPGTHIYCNMAVPTVAWGPYPAPFFYPNAGQPIISECNALILNMTGLWH